MYSRNNPSWLELIILPYKYTDPILVARESTTEVVWEIGTEMLLLVLKRVLQIGEERAWNQIQMSRSILIVTILESLLQVRH